MKKGGKRDSERERERGREVEKRAFPVRFASLQPVYSGKILKRFSS